MRLTVGPLPSAVYWRRRAVVLGALLLFLIVLIYSCSGPGGSAENTGTSGSSSPGASTPTRDVLTPETGAPPTTEEAVAPESADRPVNSDPSPEQPPTAAVASDVCTDAEISVIPVPSQTAPKVGVTIELGLKIKNVSNRTCRRDVGADLQEIYIKLGAQPIWSSDKCGTAKGSKVQSLTPGFELAYQVSWNGRDSSRCANGVAAGAYPQPGEYQLFGRLGTKVSNPVKLTITA